MPIPWLVAAAVVVGVGLVAAASDDSPSSSDSDEDERLEQESEARIQRERANLTKEASSLKKACLAEVREYLECSAAELAELPRVTKGITSRKLERVLRTEQQANSEYAQSMGEILDMSNSSQSGLSQKDRKAFLVNLQVLESFYGPIPLCSESKRDLAALRQAGRQLERLLLLKQQIEEQG